jgi:superfamily I DNA/RNA helicase
MDIVTTQSTRIDPLKLRDEITAQILAHDYSKGALLLLAGPGTGKSFSLKITIKNQVAKGGSLGDFYAMTLTNAAAGKFEAEVKKEKKRGQVLQ